MFRVFSIGRISLNVKNLELECIFFLKSRINSGNYIQAWGS